MLNYLIEKKSKGKSLSLSEYYGAIDYMLKNGVNKDIKKLFLALNSFGMTKNEVYYLTLAIRDSGKVLKYNQCILEKHSTGGIGDASSMVLIPLLASMGYKIIKTTARSFVFTNGGADRFGAIPGFSTKLTNEEIQNVLETTNACVLSHKGDMCKADSMLFDLREEYDMEEDINLLAASIAAKKLASGAKVVLVDVKFGEASVVKTYGLAKKLASILKFIFKKENVKSIIAITNTDQTIGEGIGNAIEVADAIEVLQGKQCALRDIAVIYAVEMMTKALPKIAKPYAIELAESALDNGYAYKRFLEIVKAQGGDDKAVAAGKVFNPYHSVNFLASQDGYVGDVDSLALGEIVKTICKDSHDNNIGIRVRVKVGDYVKAGETVVTFYYKDKEDVEKYKEYILKCVKLTDTEIKPVKIIERII